MMGRREKPSLALKFRRRLPGLGGGWLVAAATAVPRPRFTGSCPGLGYPPSREGAKGRRCCREGPRRRPWQELGEDGAPAVG